MIEALILAKLHNKPEQRTGTTGRPFVTCKARAATDADAVFVNVVAFSESTCAALLALDAGDAVALAGTLKAGAWIDRDGNARPSLDLVAAQVLTFYALAKKRKASSEAGNAQHLTGQPTTTGNDGAPDSGPDDAWLRGEQ